MMIVMVVVVVVVVISVRLRYAINWSVIERFKIEANYGMSEVQSWFE